MEGTVCTALIPEMWWFLACCLLPCVGWFPPTLTHSKRSLFAQKGVKGVGCDKHSNLDVLRNLSVRPKAIHPGQVLAGQLYQWRESPHKSLGDIVGCRHCGSPDVSVSAFSKHGEFVCTSLSLECNLRHVASMYIHAAHYSSTPCVLQDRYRWHRQMKSTLPAMQ